AIALTQCVAHRKGFAVPGLRVIVQPLVLHHLCDAVMVGKAFIIRHFIPYPQPDEHGDGHTDGETPDVDRGSNPVPDKVAQCGFDVVFKHSYWTPKSKPDW